MYNLEQSKLVFSFIVADVNSRNPVIDPGYVNKKVKKSCFDFHRDFQAPEKTFSQLSKHKIFSYFPSLSAISDVLGPVLRSLLKPNPFQIRIRHSALFSSCKSGLRTTFFQLSCEKLKKRNLT
jgi:hypothetical protein